MIDFFISRNSADRDWAQWVAWQLQEVGGYTVVVQDWDFRPGHSFVQKMAEAVSQARRTIAILSPSYVEAEYSAAEWYAAFRRDPTGKERRLLLVRVRPAEPPELLKSIVRIDLDTAPDKQSAAQRLLEGVKEGRAVPAVEPGFPGQGQAPGATGEAMPYPTETQQERVAVAVQAQREHYEAGRQRAHVAAGLRVVGSHVTVVAGNFYDRTEYRRKLGEYIADPGTRLVSVIGRRGIGKSALVDHVLRDLEGGRWPHTDEQIPVAGIVYISTRTRNREISLERVFLDCASVLGGEAQTALEHLWAQADRSDADKVEALLDALGDRLCVVLLDNLEDALDEQGNVRDPGLRSLLDVSLVSRTGPRLVVTSQVPLALDPSALPVQRMLRLEAGLPDEEAVALLRELSTRADLRMAGASDDELLHAVRRVGGNPRAIALLVGTVSRRAIGLQQLVATFADQVDVLSALVSRSYESLDEDARTVVQALAVLRRAVPPAAVDFLLEPLLPGVDVRPVVDRLTASQHVAFDQETEQLSLHPLDSDYTLATLSTEDPPRRTALEQRAAQYYRGFRQSPAQWRTSDDLAPHLLEFEHLLAAGLGDDAARLLIEISEFLVWHGSSRRVMALHERVSGVITDPLLRARHAFALGLARHVIGPLTEAVELFDTAVSLSRDLGDPVLEAQALGMRGEISRLLGDLEDAVTTLSASVTLARSLQQDKLEETALLPLGLALLYRAGEGDLDRTRSVVQRLREVAARGADPAAYARTLDLECLLAFRLGDSTGALERGDEAIAKYDEARLPWAVGYVYNVQGMALLALGRTDEAVAALTQARLKGREVEGSRIEGLASYNLAWAHWTRGSLEEAAHAAERAADALRTQGASESEAAAALLRGATCLRAGDLQGAATSLLTAARASAGTADLYTPSVIAGVAQALARAAGLSNVAEQASEFR